MGKSQKILTDVITVPTTLGANTTMYSDVYTTMGKGSEVMADIYCALKNKVTNTVTVGIQSGTRNPQPAIASGSKLIGAITVPSTNDIFTVKLSGVGWNSENTGKVPISATTAATVTVTAAANALITAAKAAADTEAVAAALNGLLETAVFTTTGEYSNRSAAYFVKFYKDPSSTKINIKTTEAGANFGMVLTDSTGTPLADIGVTAGTYYGQDIEWLTLTTSTAIANGAAVPVYDLPSAILNVGDYYRFYLATNGTGALASDHGVTIDAQILGQETVAVAANRPSKVYADVDLEDLVLGNNDYTYTTNEIEIDGKNNTVKVDVIITDRSKVSDNTYLKLQTTQGVEETVTIGAGGSSSTRGGTNPDGKSAGNTSTQTSYRWTTDGAVWQTATADGSKVAITNGVGAAVFSLSQTTKLERFVRAYIYTDGTGAVAADSGILVNITIS